VVVDARVEAAIFLLRDLLPRLPEGRAIEATLRRAICVRSVHRS